MNIGLSHNNINKASVDASRFKDSQGFARRIYTRLLDASYSILSIRTRYASHEPLTTPQS